MTTVTQGFMQLLNKIVKNPVTTALESDEGASFENQMQSVVKQALPYDTLAVRIEQAAGAAPSIEVTYENTLNAVPVLARTGAGIYTIAGVVTTAQKDKVYLGMGAGAGKGIITAQVIAGDLIQIKTFDDAGVAADTMLLDFHLSVKVYK